MLITMPWRQIVRRLPQVCLGLVLFGVGVTLMKQAFLGNGAWNVFHEGIAELTGLSFGAVIMLTGVFVVLLFIPLKEKLGLGTVLNAIIIGATVDIVSPWFGEPDAMWLRVAMMLGGPVVIGLGSGLYIGGGLGPGPRDGLMTAINRRGVEIWKARTGIEITVLILGLLLGGTAGFGTAWFTLSIGPLVQFFLPHFKLRAPDAPAKVAASKSG